MTTPDRQTEIDRLETLDDIPDTEVSPADIREREALRAALYPDERPPRNRYRVTFYVTEGPGEDGEFPEADAVACGIEAELLRAWRGDTTTKLDSDVTAEDAS